MRRSLVFSAIAATALSLALSSAAVAESPSGDAPWPRVEADFGAGWNILSIHASAFRPYTGGLISFNALGYRVSTTVRFEAPVSLPSGSGIGYLAVFGYDLNFIANVEASLHRYRGFGTPMGCSPCVVVPPTIEQLATAATIGSSGYQYALSLPLSPLHTVDNFVYTGGQYVVRVSLDAGPFTTYGDLGFRGVEVWWKRQISPAPAMASFADVPSTHLFFREIEALKAAGITLGCTASTFCPDGTLTRAQMAAFLARALGLYWQF